MRDIAKDEICTSLGYSVIRIPYFVQLTSETIKHFFNEDVDIESSYPHGFIDPSAMLPCDFNPQGQKSYVEILSSLKKSGLQNVADMIERSAASRLNALEEKIARIRYISKP